MGDKAPILLVDRRAVLLAAATLALEGCGDRAVAPVDPRDYQAFFLWPGVVPPSWLKQAQEVYLLAGEVRHRSRSGFQPLRATPQIHGPRLWLTVRVERLDWQEAIYRDVLRTLELWDKAGNRIEGLQIDFDAATRGLDHYTVFLADLRARLPSRWKLSITGLMDWSVGSERSALRNLAKCIDDLVIQTYQGRRTIPGYQRYLASLSGLGMPYRVGLMQGGDWDQPDTLSTDPNFRGYVVFLINR